MGRMRVIAGAGALAVVVGIVVASLAAQGAPSPGQSAPALTAWGDPDLQGIWSYATITPLERPAELGDKQFFTDEEAAQFEAETLERRDNDRRDRDPSREQVVNGTQATADVARAYNQFWWDYGTNIVGTNRTSLIVDPADGRIPALTPQGQARVDARGEMRERAAHGPEDRSLGERCINWGVAGPPMISGAYNNNVQLLQTPDYVVIYNEMIHGARIVPLDGRPRPNVPQVSGISRARWDGRTLVVETANFSTLTDFRGASENLRLTERFTRLDPTTLQYDFRVEDPTTFTKPWSASMPMTLSQDKIYEYACHEGNYGMSNLLMGARAIEAAGTAATPSTR